MFRPRSMQSCTLHLLAHTPLRPDERESAVKRQESQARVRQWLIAPALLLAGFAIAYVGVQNYLVDTHPVITTLATIVFGGFLSLILMGIGAALLPRLEEADHTPLSPYWHSVLESETKLFPEIDAMRVAWVDQMGCLTGVEYQLLTRAVRLARLQAAAPTATSTVAPKATP